MNFKKGDVVVRTRPSGRDDSSAPVNELAVLVEYTPQYGESWRVVNERTKERYYTGTAIWNEENFEYELVYNSPLYKALS